MSSEDNSKPDPERRQKSSPDSTSEASDRRLLDVLRQTRRYEDFKREGSSAWLTLYENWHDREANGGRSSALVPKRRHVEVLSKDTWDIAGGNGAPGFTEYYGGSRKRRKYLRNGYDDGTEFLVITQDHFGIRPDMLPQLSEEFRLFHNLWVDQTGSRLYKINMDGTEELVAEVSKDLVRVRTKYVRQFQAAKQMELVLYLDSVQFVDDPSESARLDRVSLKEQTDEAHLTLHASDHVHGKKRPFSRLLGKRVLKAPPISKAGVWPFDVKQEVFPDFIIGEDSNGDPIKNSCDPEKLADYFGKNPAAPHYLTPVFFRRDVLQRYYEHPEKYSVSDGYLKCGGLWGLRLDNDHPEHVMVFLGDLGRDLPESERPYWQSFNITPTGGMSATAFSRSFEGNFATPEAPDLLFKHNYEKFKRKWVAKFGWDLFKDPEPSDVHVLQRLRIPLNESQPEFEDQVIGLTKVLVDSLNERAIQKTLASKQPDERGLGKLERWLQQVEYPYVERDMAFLRRLQRIRSRMVAHRKGSDYERFLEAEGIDQNLIREIVLSLWNADRLLRDLAAHFDIDLASH